MRTALRYADARLTTEGADGGLDVKALEAGAQVKFYASPVGIADVQRLKGTVRSSQRAIFYASRPGYTKAATQYASSAGVALFRYAESGLVVAENAHASTLLKVRARVSLVEPPEAELTRAEWDSVRSQILELRYVVGEYTQRNMRMSLASAEQIEVLRRFMRAAKSGAEIEQIRSRYRAWIETYEARQTGDARSAFSEAVADHFPSDQFRVNPMPILIHLTKLLPTLPELMMPVYATMPMSSAETDAWTEYWYEHRISRWDTAGVDWPDDLALCGCGLSLTEGTHPNLRDDLPVRDLPPGRPPAELAMMWPERPGVIAKTTSLREGWYPSQTNPSEELRWDGARWTGESRLAAQAVSP